MKKTFTAATWREDDWFISQCLQVDVASQGKTEDEALDNLKEALEPHFEAPQATRPPRVQVIEVEVGRLNPLHYREVKRRLEGRWFRRT